MRTALLALTMVLGAACPAAAAEQLFDLIGVNGRATTFLDVNSRQQAGPVVTFTTMVVNPRLPDLKIAGTPHYLTQKLEIDCGLVTAHSVVSTLYGQNNEVLLSSAAPNQPVKINPGSIFDREYEYVCLQQRPNPGFAMTRLQQAVTYADAALKAQADAGTPKDPRGAGAKAPGAPHP